MADCKACGRALRLVAPRCNLYECPLCGLGDERWLAARDTLSGSYQPQVPLVSDHFCPECLLPLHEEDEWCWATAARLTGMVLDDYDVEESQP